MSDILGWIATGIMVIASIQIAHKNILGLWFMLLGNSIFMLVGILSHLSSLVAVSILMAILDYYGILKWKEKNE